MMQHRWNKHSFAHKMVAELQVAMAHEVYDALASKDDKFYKEWNETEFVNQVAPTLRDEARGVLAELLGRNDVSDHDKEQIYEALMLDRCVPNEDRWHIPASPYIQ